MPRPEKVRTFRLTRNFALGAAFVMIATGWSLGALNRSLTVDQLERMVENNNSALTRAFANDVWRRFRPFVSAAHTLLPGALSADPRTAELHRAVLVFMAGTPVVPMKLYDTHALTVFSTDPAQVGERLEDDPDPEEIERFRAAASGGAASELERIDGAQLEPPVAGTRWALSSYVPVRPGGGAAEI